MQTNCYGNKLIKDEDEGEYLNYIDNDLAFRADDEDGEFGANTDRMIAIDRNLVDYKHNT